jgi:hypothetical protein
MSENLKWALVFLILAFLVAFPAFVGGYLTDKEIRKAEKGDKG